MHFQFLNRNYSIQFYFFFNKYRTYVITVPIVTADGISANSSTLHQLDVDSWHRDSFKSHRRLINAMLLGRVPYPSFVKPACKFHRDLDNGDTIDFLKKTVFRRPLLGEDFLAD